MNSLGAGLVPPVGLHHLAVGRKRETETLLHDVERISQGGSAFRLIIAPHGGGKTFSTRLTQSVAINRGLVVVQADLAVEHRLHGSGDGKGRKLYADMIQSLRFKGSPEGEGLRALINGWILRVQNEAGGLGGSSETPINELENRLRKLNDLVGGYEFAEVLLRYVQAHLDGNNAVQDAALRWLRAECSTKTEAYQQLGVRRIIGDNDILASLKLLATFSRIAGYQGLLVAMDELVTLTHRLPSSRSREGSFLVLLNMINDCFQNKGHGLGFLLAGTPGCLRDPDKGLFSYEALRTRLQPYTHGGTLDFSGPVIELAPLTIDELVVLLHNIRRVQALGDESKYKLTDDAIKTFTDRIDAKLGSKRPRDARGFVRPFVSLLQLLEENPSLHWRDALSGVITQAHQPGNEAEKELSALDLRG